MVGVKQIGSAAPCEAAAFPEHCLEKVRKCNSACAERKLTCGNNRPEGRESKGGWGGGGGGVQ